MCSLRSRVLRAGNLEALDIAIERGSDAGIIGRFRGVRAPFSYMPLCCCSLLVTRLVVTPCYRLILCYLEKFIHLGRILLQE